MSNRIQKLVALKKDSPLSPPDTQPARGPDPALLSPDQFAAATGIGIYTVRIWMRRGIICSLPVGTTGRVRRIPAGEVERIRGLHGHGAIASIQE